MTDPEVKAKRSLRRKRNIMAKHLRESGAYKLKKVPNKKKDQKIPREKLDPRKIEEYYDDL